MNGAEGYRRIQDFSGSLVPIEEKLNQEVLIPITGNRRFARLVYRTH